MVLLCSGFRIEFLFEFPSVSSRFMVRPRSVKWYCSGCWTSSPGATLRSKVSLVLVVTSILHVLDGECVPHVRESLVECPTHSRPGLSLCHSAQHFLVLCIEFVEAVHWMMIQLFPFMRPIASSPSMSREGPGADESGSFAIWSGTIDCTVFV